MSTAPERRSWGAGFLAVYPSGREVWFDNSEGLKVKVNEPLPQDASHVVARFLTRPSRLRWSHDDDPPEVCALLRLAKRSGGPSAPRP